MPGQVPPSQAPVRTTADGSVSAAPGVQRRPGRERAEPELDHLIARGARSREADLVVGLADVRRAGAAVGAVAARDDPFGHAAHAGRDARHVLAHRLDDARPFVAEHERVADERGVDLRQQLEVGAAHAAVRRAPTTRPGAWVSAARSSRPMQPVRSTTSARPVVPSARDPSSSEIRARDHAPWPRHLDPPRRVGRA